MGSEFERHFGQGRSREVFGVRLKVVYFTGTKAQLWKEVCECGRPPSKSLGPGRSGSGSVLRTLCALFL